MLAKEPLLITLVFLLLLAPTSSAHGANGQAEPQLAEIRVDKDNIGVTTSVKVKPGTYRVEDMDKNGVLQIDADDVTIDFQGATLWGVLKGEECDRFEGVGISINGHQNVTVTNARMHGFRYNIRVASARGIQILDSDVSFPRGPVINDNGEIKNIWLNLRDG